MKKSIAVIGTGAIGSSVAGDLARAGLDVTLIDQWPEHVAAMKAHGLNVTIPDGDYRVPVRAINLGEVSSLRERFDVVLMSCKSYDSVWTAHLIKPHLAEDGVLISVQNSVNDETLSPIVGSARILGCAFELSAEVFTPGTVQRNTPRGKTWFGIGEHHGRITPRLREIESIFKHVGKVECTTNIWGSKWSKLVNSSMILGPFGMLGMQSYEATAIPEVFKLCVQLGRETMAVGQAHGINFEPIFGLSVEQFMGSDDHVVETLLRTILLHHGPELARKLRGVVLQDFLKGRMTEAAHLNGLVVRKGREAGIPTPANAAVMQVIDRIERGELKPVRTNITLVENLLKGDEA
jgi:2-dehydropantoate 2-reductase